jgi:hypothetical protein
LKNDIAGHAAQLDAVLGRKRLWRRKTGPEPEEE